MGTGIPSRKQAHKTPGSCHRILLPAAISVSWKGCWKGMHQAAAAEGRRPGAGGEALLPCLCKLVGFAWGYARRPCMLCGLLCGLVSVLPAWLPRVGARIGASVSTRVRPRLRPAATCRRAAPTPALCTWSPAKTSPLGERSVTAFLPYARITFRSARRSGSCHAPPDFTRHVWKPGCGADRRHSKH